MSLFFFPIPWLDESESASGPYSQFSDPGSSFLVTQGDLVAWLKGFLRSGLVDLVDIGREHWQVK